MIRPRRTSVAGFLVIDQPLERELCLILPRGVACRLVHPDKAPSYKTHTLGRMAFLNPYNRAQVDGEPPHTLLEQDAQVLVIERQRPEEFGTQPVESIVSAVVVSLQPL